MDKSHVSAPVVLTVRMPREMRDAIQRVAAYEYRTMNAEICRLIEQRIAEAEQAA